MQLDPEPRPSIQHRLSGHFRRTFITGLLALIPLALTYLILRWLFSTIHGAVQPVICGSFDREIPGGGLGVGAWGRRGFLLAVTAEKAEDAAFAEGEDLCFPALGDLLQLSDSVSGGHLGGNDTRRDGMGV